MSKGAKSGLEMAQRRVAAKRAAKMDREFTKPKRRTRVQKLEITERQWKVIEQMARDMCTHDEIADYLGVSKRTLYNDPHRERFMRTVKMRQASTRWNVRKKQREAAEGGQPVPSIWWGKQHLNQSDRQQVAGPGGGPIEVYDRAAERLSELLARVAPRLKAKG